MVFGKYEAALTELERSKESPGILLQNAANILDLDFDALVKKCYDLPTDQQQQQASMNSFREQWLLRWFLKQLQPLTLASQSEKSERNSKQFVFDSRTWALLIYLMNSIPSDVCIGILFDRAFPKLYTNCVEVLVQSAHSSGRRLSDNQYEPDEYLENDGPPKKRQRLEVNDIDIPAETSEDGDRRQTLEIALEVARGITKLFQQRSHSRRRQPQMSNFLWSLSDQDISMLFGASMRLLTYQLSRCSPDKMEKLLVSLQESLSFWNVCISHRRVSRSKFYKEFNVHCLWPSLSLLNLLRSIKLTTDESVKILHSLEQMVVTTTILPIRAIFLEKFAEKWKAEGALRSWDQIGPTVAAISDELGQQHKQAIETGSAIGVLHPMTLSLIFDLAVRTIPHINIRQRLREQPWLDALLLTLVYFSSPRFPRMTKGESGFLESMDIGKKDGESQMSPSFAIIEDVIKVAVGLRYRPSLQVLEYLVSTALCWEDPIQPWELISGLLQLDINTIIPNSGIASSKNCLHLLCIKIQNARTSTSEYNLIRDQIIIPLQKGFVKARDLTSFIVLWNDNLQKAMMATATRDLDQDPIPAVLVWHDEDLFKAFGVSIKLNPSPNLAQDLALEILDLMQKIQKDQAILLELLSKVSIFTIMLDVGRDQSDQPMLSSDLLKNISHGVLMQLQSKNEHRSQRWRLWSLLVHLCRLGVDTPVPSDIMAVLKAEQDTYSFKSMKELASLPSGPKTPGELHEYLQCFLLVLQQAKSHHDLTALMVEELKSLKNILQRLNSEKIFIGDQQIWNGRFLDFDSQEKFVGACIAHLVSQLQSFETNPTLLQEISACLVQAASVSASVKQTNLAEPTLLQLGNTTFLCEELTQSKNSRNVLLKQVLEECRESTSERFARPNKIWLEMLVLSPKSELDSMAEMLVSCIFSEDTVPSIDLVTGWLSTLDELNKIKRLAVLQPQSWGSWMKKLEILSARSYDPSSKSFQIAGHFLSNLLRSMWKRARSIQQEVRRKTEVSSILNWTQEAVMSSESFDYGLSIFLAIRIVLLDLSQDIDRLDSLIARKQFTNTETRFLNVTTEDLQNLVGKLSDSKFFPTIYTIINTLSDFTSSFVGDWSKVIKILESATKECAMLRLEKDNGQAAAFFDSLTLVESRLWLLFSALNPHYRTDTTDLQFANVLHYERYHSRPITNLEMNMFSELISNYINVFDPAFPASSEPRLSYSDLQPKIDALQKDRTINPFIFAELNVRVGRKDYLDHQFLFESSAQVADLTSIPDTSKFHSLLLNIETSKIILTEHSEIINQNTLEMLLKSIIRLLSGSSSLRLVLDETYQSYSGGAKALYDRICALVGIVLSRFRRRLADRYHLLLPIMQKLLRCLFYPGKVGLMNQQSSLGSNDASKFLKSLPIWLTESEAALPQCSAEHYSRLLSSICNPTMSAARSSRKRARNELKDETMKVRSIAGQHMQYVLMEYSRSTLNGQILPDVKEKLMPGMYAVLSSMRRDLMRSMNAKMDASSRAIFKILYDDWIKFGKWDNN